ncbi:mature-parasite-infected erythrocyte surface antigen, putative [Perkinsus marinus ATCC 50983]|uniref:Mature-parasite-infected erythrocyte surface antigen, putative n=1 Tax=Perkinsus marinus (strain ATCC 50983 / TXsc) TaxID=423536 RepID=C5L703_PERM5|nr:mature-parasite-infected erythrocyte surface antigen, putative [Perkinsus marinus ATCC 50983]EER07265.1 mature-parasite-infected erythrocyte surface antigen, putative [Perkinsus marinus ATCC 50983]|eukprot:XP_002775449.1 mature-parasite-infected erythrocyte surface antigen, putative [Perkinsus marinus ATCC 50983]
MAYPPKQLPNTKADDEPAISAAISLARREKLLAIKKREEMKDLIVNKLKKKHSTREDSDKDDCSSEKSAMINKEVNRLLDNTNIPVTEANLNRLERRIQKKVDCGALKGDDGVSVVSGVSAYSQRSGGSSYKGPQRATNTMEAIPEDEEGLSVTGRAIEGGEQRRYNWSRLDEYSRYLHEQDSIRQKLNELEVKKRLAEDLRRQMRESRSRKAQLVEEEKKFKENQLIEIDEWQKYEDKVNAERRDKAIKEQKDRELQMNFDKARQEREEEKRRNEEAKLVAKITREMALEKKKILQRKQAQKDAMVTIMKENVKERKIREEERLRQIQFDIESMAEYNRILDAQEKARKDELEARVARQKALMETMQDTVVKEQNAKANEMEDRADRQLAEANARAEERERLKEERLREIRQETQEYLFHQMAERESRKKHNQMLKDLQAQILESDTKAYRENEALRAQQRREFNVEHRKLLERQMRDKERQNVLTKYEMSPVEMRINRQLLDVVDKSLKERDEAMAALKQEEEEEEECEEEMDE